MQTEGDRIMNEEEFEVLKAYEWDKFIRRYPTITSQGFWARVMLLFAHKGNTQYLLWENGFLSGWIEAMRQFKKERNHE
jgi:hypothetical protein